MRRFRAPIAIGLIVLVAAALFALVHSGRRAGLLDPRSAAPTGSMALAELLRDQGVRVDVADTADQAAEVATSNSTLLVARAEYLGPAQIAQLSEVDSAIVLISASDDALAHYTPDAEQDGQVESRAREPACDLPAAVAAGSARVGGAGYRMPAAPRGTTVTLCYASGGLAPLVQQDGGGSVVTLLGSGEALMNERLGEDGNAALTMDLLGGRSHLIWYLPTLGELLADQGGEPSSLWELIPSGWKWAALQALLAGGLLALWRARRLGPVVTEPLPVVVRAAEAVEGRARLYRRVAATDRAADSLRAAARDRIASAVALPGSSADPHALVSAVAERTGRPPHEVGALLYGAAPATDSALVTLADDLDSLTREVRRP